MPLSAGVKPHSPARAVDRRRHQRVRVALLGRYMLQSRQEYPCQTLDMSPGGISIVAPVRGLVGERIVLYVEHLGRVEGQIVRHTDLGLALSIATVLPAVGKQNNSPRAGRN